MLHETWKDNTPIKKIEVIHTDAQKFTVADMLTCLLYTSPSPRDPKTSRMPSSA